MDDLRPQLRDRYRGFRARVLCVIPLATALLMVGCMALSHQIMPCPLPFSEQEKAVLAIAPTGTRREEVLRRLAAAGIDGSFGIVHTVYYCELWNRENGDRWHMNLALMFDEAGRLYKTQPADTDIAAVRDEKTKPKSVTLPSASSPTGAGQQTP